MPPAKRFACLCFPDWSITRSCRRRPELRGQAVGVVRNVARRQQLVAVSDRARAAGARPGLSAAEARALCPGLVLIEQDVIADDRTLDALGRWLTRFTPAVSRGEPLGHAELTPVLHLDLTGCERLFGGIDVLVDAIRQSLARLDLPVKMAVAPTPGAAWALAVTASDVVRVEAESTFLDALRPLPVACLRLNDQTLTDLTDLGLRRVGDVLALPRGQLPSRFGATLLKRIDQLTGALPEPLTKLAYEPPVTARKDFDAPIDALDSVWLIFEKLLDLALSDLARRNHGVRTLRLTFKPDNGWGRPTFWRTIELARPHRDRATLLNLIRCEVERVDLEHGFVRFQLDVPRHESTVDVETDLFDQRAVESATELDRLAERVRAKLGRDAVPRPELIESYLPERAWRAAATLGPSKADVAPLTSLRPLKLFATPEEIRVVCEPSDDRTGSPRQFTARGVVYRVACDVGPERIAGEWWHGHHRTRDYYAVEDASGCRFWIFRVLHPRPQGGTPVARWFMHGRFA